MGMSDKPVKHCYMLRGIMLYFVTYYTVSQKTDLDIIDCNFKKD